MDNYSKTLVRSMARVTGTTLTDEHLGILEFAYTYYRAHGVGPLYRNIRKYTGATRDEIERLFPKGLGSVLTWVGIPVQTAEGGCKPMGVVDVAERREVYLDYNATTPLRPEVLKTLIEFYEDPRGYGNPSSGHLLGKEAYHAVREARSEIGQCLGARPENIIFTGGGSEANNLALKGIAFRHLDRKGHIISTRTEHPSVLRTLEYLSTMGFETSWAELDDGGGVIPESVGDQIRGDTILVCVMAANNEIGTVNPLMQIGEICLGAGIPFMVDAVQGFGRIPIDCTKMGTSLVSISGHKIYAPKGIGALYVSEDLQLVPLLHGGSQESGIRAGTENVGSIKAFGLAARLAHREMKGETQRLLGLREYFLGRLKEEFPGITVNGSLKNRLPNNLSIGFPGVDGGSLLLSLNNIGVYASSGSACSAGSLDSSHVLKAIGVDTDRYGVIRFSMGLQTRKADLDYLLHYLPAIVAGLER